MAKQLTTEAIAELTEAAQHFKELLHKHGCVLCFDRNVDSANDIVAVRDNIAFLDPNLDIIKDTAEPLSSFTMPVLFELMDVKSYDSGYDTMVDEI